MPWIGLKTVPGETYPHWIKIIRLSATASYLIIRFPSVDALFLRVAEADPVADDKGVGVIFTAQTANFPGNGRISRLGLKETRFL